MRKMLRALSALLVVLTVLLVPAQAFADVIPRTDEIYVAGDPLSLEMPKGMSYDSGTGTLTLNNYNGGAISVDASGRMDGDWNVHLNINLIGTNYINVNGGASFPGISVRGANTVEGWGNSLWIASASGGSLTINCTFTQSSSEDIGFYGIATGGDVQIRGNAKVSIVMNTGDVSGIKNSSGVGVVATGIYSQLGQFSVMDNAQLDISISGEGAMHAAGIRSGIQGHLNILTSKPVTIDLTHISVTGKKDSAEFPGNTCGFEVYSPASGSQITIANCPVFTVKAGYVYHSVSPQSLDNPKVTGYTYAANAGQYTTTHTYTSSTAKSVDDLTVTMKAPADPRYWGGHVVPTITVKDGSKTLEQMKDYAVIYTPNNIDMGTVSVSIEGMGSYVGTRSIGTFKITSPFSDVSSSTPHVKDILWLYINGITTGFDDGTFRPYADVARCDMAAFLYRLAGEPAYTPSTKDKAYFSDVDESTPHAKEVWWLAHEGISVGWTEEDGTHTFRPYDSIARCDMAAFLMRLAEGKDAEEMYVPSTADMKAFSDVGAETPHANAVWWMYHNGISTGFEDGTFRPYDEIARCDMAAFLHRMEDKGLV